MADPTLIACLYPSAEGQRGFHGIENALRTIHMNPSRRIEPLRQNESRESTAAPEDGGDADLADPEDNGGDNHALEGARSTGHEYSFGLRLGFDDERKSALGILIGTSPNCDIVVPKRGRLAGIAPYHCSITFDAQQRLILKDLQTPEDRRRPKGIPDFVPGTAVTYNGKGGQKRCVFTWILAGHVFVADNQPVILALHDELKFEIVVAPQDMASSSYKDKVTRFLAGPSFRTDDLSLGVLGLSSMGSTAQPSGVQTPAEIQLPAKDAILLDNGYLGSGAFAMVTRVWNVSTGLEYASKQPLQKKHWEYLKREINVLKGIHHEHIVNCIPEFSTTEPVPRLVLEYVSLGTLEDQHDQTPLSVEEAFTVLCQGISGLRYLHEREDPIAHRDIKPSNILVQSRFPLHIKLSDFGLSRANLSYLRTYCGTPRYTAPEVFAGENYDACVDIWSLGVVVLQYARGLPESGRWGFDGATWTANLVQTVETEARTLRCPLLAFLSTAMLVRDRHTRYSAHRCWTMAQQLDPSEFSCSTPSWVSQPQDDDGATVKYTTPDAQRLLGAQDTVIGPLPPSSPPAHSSGVTNHHRRRSGAPSPSPVVSVRRQSLSRVSKLAKVENKSAKRRDHAAAEEVAYFYDKFSDPLHPLFVGSSLAQEPTPSEWTGGTTRETGDAVLRSQVEVVGDEAGGLAAGSPLPGGQGVSEGSVEKRVYLLGDIVQKWDETGTGV